MPGSIHSKEAIDFYKSIGAPPRAISILEDGFKLPFINEEVSPFWVKNNKSLFTYYDFAKKKLEESEKQLKIQIQVSCYGLK